jgi:hypothetical protein
MPGAKRLFTALLVLAACVYRETTERVWARLAQRTSLRLLSQEQHQRRLSAAARGGAAAAPPFRATIVNHRMDHGTEMGDLAYHPYFQFTLFPPRGEYPVSVVADAFVQCSGATAPSIVVLSRHYMRTPDLNHSLMGVEVLLPSGGLLLPPGRWHIERNYETAAIGTFALPAAGVGSAACAPGAPPLPVRIAYNTTSAVFNLTRSPEPPRSDFAMVAVFSFSRFLLRLWLEYWYAIGVDTFYLFYNGDHLNPQNVTRLQEEVAGFRGSVVIVEWNMLHWIQTDGRDITCGQPVAINNALQRWRHLHKFMAFYDTDEFLVLPRKDTLMQYVEHYSRKVEPIVALRSMCSWGQFNLSHPLAQRAGLDNIVKVTIDHVAWLPLERGKPYSREKYFLNTSAVAALGIKNINIHGVYSHQHTGAGGWAGEPSIIPPEGEFEGYHLHLLNVPDDSRKMDSREIFLYSKPILDDNLAQAVRKGLTARVRAKQPAKDAGE